MLKSSPMATVELIKPAEVILNEVSVIRASDRQPELLPQLAKIYFQTWSDQGLCTSLAEAEAKMAAFDPESCFVLVDSSGKAYALIQTLPVKLPALADLPKHYPTYASVEAASKEKNRPKNPNFVICFSINALPGYRVRTDDQTLSLPRYLINALPTEDTNQVAYSRFDASPTIPPLEYYLDHRNNPKSLGPVGMHEYFGALTGFIISSSRPEDIKSAGSNILVVYPKNGAEAAAFAKAKAERLRRLPPHTTVGPITSFLDLPL